MTCIALQHLSGITEGSGPSAAGLARTVVAVWTLQAVTLAVIELVLTRYTGSCNSRLLWTLLEWSALLKQLTAILRTCLAPVAFFAWPLVHFGSIMTLDFVAVEASCSYSTGCFGLNVQCVGVRAWQAWDALTTERGAVVEPRARAEYDDYRRARIGCRNRRIRIIVSSCGSHEAVVASSAFISWVIEHTLSQTVAVPTRWTRPAVCQFILVCKRIVSAYRTCLY